MATEGVRLARRAGMAAMIGMVFSLIAPNVWAQSDQHNTFVTLDSYEHSYELNEEAHLFGTVLSQHPDCYDGVTVTIREDEHDDFIPIFEQWPITATVTTDEYGSFRLSTEAERSKTYLAFVEPPPGSLCEPRRSEYSGLLVRAEISLSTRTGVIEKGDTVRINVQVAPQCESARPEPSHVGGVLYLEKLVGGRWKRLTSEWDEKEVCTFTFVRRIRLSNTFRVVGEGTFVQLGGFESYWVGNTSDPLLVRVRGAP